MHQEMPSITGSVYGSSTLDAAKLLMGVGRMDQANGLADARRIAGGIAEAINIGNNFNQPAAAQKEQPTMSSAARIGRDIYLEEARIRRPEDGCGERRAVLTHRPERAYEEKRAQMD